MNRNSEQAEKATSFMKIPFWGCPGLNFKANLPFHVVRHAASSAERPAYAAFEKEIRMALQSTTSFFKTLKNYKKPHKKAQANAPE